MLIVLQEPHYHMINTITVDTRHCVIVWFKKSHVLAFFVSALILLQSSQSLVFCLRYQYCSAFVMSRDQHVLHKLNFIVITITAQILHPPPPGSYCRS
jgi:hypothetical protein